LYQDFSLIRKLRAIISILNYVFLFTFFKIYFLCWLIKTQRSTPLKKMLIQKKVCRAAKVQSKQDESLQNNLFLQP